MSSGVKATFRLLAQTQNRAAEDLLLVALDGPDPDLRDEAIRALLARRTPEANAAIFQRLPQMDPRARAVVSERSDRLAKLAGEALVQPDPQTVETACRMIVEYRLYEAADALVAALGEGTNPFAPAIARAILDLTEAFYADLSDPAVKRKGLENVRLRLTTCLEDGTRKFFKHQQPEVVEAFLVLAKQQNAVLRNLLSRREEATFAPLFDTLTHSERGGVLRLLLSFLDDPQMPLAVVEAICQRSDRRFVEYLFRFIGDGPSKNVAESLRRFEKIVWAKPGHPLLAELDEPCQRGAVELLLLSGMKRPALQQAIHHILQNGNAGGRRAAARALASFDDAESNVLCIKALNDPDPEVRAEVLRQIRSRNVPNAMLLLIRMVDSPEPAIKEALRDAMPEFTLQQFLANFDSLEEELRETAARLVTKVDPEAVSLLRQELRHRSPVRRRRAVLAAEAMGVVAEIESQVVELLTDTDHMVRVAAAQALAGCQSVPSWDALRDAMFDRSVIVQEAAEQSLERICQSLQIVNPNLQESLA